MKYTHLSLEKYLEELASENPIPGGGSASAYAACLGMGLIQMVGRVALARKKKSSLGPEEEEKDRENRLTVGKIVEVVEKIKKDALEIVNLDPKVYQEVIQAYAHPEKLEDALQNSFRLQADLGLLAVMAFEWNKNLLGLVSGSIQNDLRVSEALLEAAFRGAVHTAEINIRCMKDPDKKGHAEKALEELKARMEKAK